MSTMYDPLGWQSDHMPQTAPFSDHSSSETGGNALPSQSDSSVLHASSLNLDEGTGAAAVSLSFNFDREEDSQALDLHAHATAGAFPYFSQNDVSARVDHRHDSCRNLHADCHADCEDEVKRTETKDTDGNTEPLTWQSVLLAAGASSSPSRPPAGGGGGDAGASVGEDRRGLVGLKHVGKLPQPLKTRAMPVSFSPIIAPSPLFSGSSLVSGSVPNSNANNPNVSVSPFSPKAAFGGFCPSDQSNRAAGQETGVGGNFSGSAYDFPNSVAASASPHRGGSSPGCAPNDLRLSLACEICGVPTPVTETVAVRACAQGPRCARKLVNELETLRKEHGRLQNRYATALEQALRLQETLQRQERDIERERQRAAQAEKTLEKERENFLLAAQQQQQQQQKERKRLRGTSRTSSASSDPVSGGSAADGEKENSVPPGPARDSRERGESKENKDRERERERERGEAPRDGNGRPRHPIASFRFPTKPSAPTPTTETKVESNTNPPSGPAKVSPPSSDTSQANIQDTAERTVSPAPTEASASAPSTSPASQADQTTAPPSQQENVETPLCEETTAETEETETSPASHDKGSSKEKSADSTEKDGKDKALLTPDPNENPYEATGAGYFCQGWMTPKDLLPDARRFRSCTTPCAMGVGNHLRCKWRHNCFYAHYFFELQHYEAFRTRMCEAFVSTGSCVYGDTCVFAHSQNGQRDRDRDRGERGEKDQPEKERGQFGLHAAVEREREKMREEYRERDTRGNSNTNTTKGPSRPSATRLQPVPFTSPSATSNSNRGDRYQEKERESQRDKERDREVIGNVRGGGAVRPRGAARFGSSTDPASSLSGDSSFVSRTHLQPRRQEGSSSQEKSGGGKQTTGGAGQADTEAAHEKTSSSATGQEKGTSRRSPPVDVTDASQFPSL
uniref:C3H1-type domain-containing protein n=1 Tax=Chromera velia CCMP2878 TaxID=1169474 RepID=A0A0G4F7T1_9ALVE|eukprot:Cvel_2950.t1-p1 / transcript=Cvel_2950.t1 / gene=Cvel_2950 / organism=Chromera_velia_CCMP2878 / gene_product=hypothetical protein / transcript_product=hypothetical protein / location=Cvel_scaffold116:111598-115298(+) / protein_length=911 / sequence_SO=supercontig / SO=protein_coding / is_pseudo=false